VAQPDINNMTTKLQIGNRLASNLKKKILAEFCLVQPLPMCIRIPNWLKGSKEELPRFGGPASVLHCDKVLGGSVRRFLFLVL
jgi:hypothetical protein